MVNRTYTKKYGLSSFVLGVVIGTIAVIVLKSVFATRNVVAVSTLCVLLVLCCIGGVILGNRKDSKHLDLPKLINEVLSDTTSRSASIDLSNIYSLQNVQEKVTECLTKYLGRSHPLLSNQQEKELIVNIVTGNIYCSWLATQNSADIYQYEMVNDIHSKHIAGPTIKVNFPILLNNQYLITTQHIIEYATLSHMIRTQDYKKDDNDLLTTIQDEFDNKITGRDTILESITLCVQQYRDLEKQYHSPSKNLEEMRAEPTDRQCLI